MATKPSKVPPKAPAGEVPAKPANRPSYIPQQNYDMPTDDQFKPTIKIAQLISPEVVEDDPAFIAGLKPGMLFNSVTKAMYDGKVGLKLIPLQVRKYYTEWTPRSMGGGFVAQYETKEEMEASADKKNEITPVFEYICLVDETDEIVQVQFNSATKYPVARQWAGFIQQHGTMCGRYYILQTVSAKNKQQQVYYKFRLLDGDWVSEERYKAMDEMMKSMAVPALPAGQGEAHHEEM